MGFAISALPPSAAIVKAARQIGRAPSGNVSNSFSAALIHETGRVLLVISRRRSFPFAKSLNFANRLYNVVIRDNTHQEGPPKTRLILWRRLRGARKRRTFFSRQEPAHHLRPGAFALAPRQPFGVGPLQHALSSIWSPLRLFNAAIAPSRKVSRHCASRDAVTPSSRDRASRSSPRKTRSTTSIFRLELHRPRSEPEPPRFPLFSMDSSSHDPQGSSKGVSKKTVRRPTTAKLP